MSRHRVDGTIVSVNVADEKGVRKQPVESITLVVDHGVEGDAHAGPWHRQVSLLASESIEKMKPSCPTVEAGALHTNSLPAVSLRSTRRPFSKAAGFSAMITWGSGARGLVSMAVTSRSANSSSG